MLAIGFAGRPFSSRPPKNIAKFANAEIAPAMLKESNNYLPFAKQVLDKGWVKPNKRIFDNSKISDHFAIIPTLQAPKNLSEPEQKLYDLVVKRFLAVFFPAAESRVTTRITEVVGHHFKTEGKVLVEPGWLQIYGRETSGDDANLVPVQKDEKVKTDKIAAQQLITKPPARYNEATLLSAMEGAGKLVEDDELREAMAAKGLGTPATRAAIIEGLLTEKYLIREGRDLIPTAKAFQLMTLLRGLGVKELTAPELTGEWEYKLSQMERGNLPRDAFMPPSSTGRPLRRRTGVNGGVLDDCRIRSANSSTLAQSCARTNSG